MRLFGYSILLSALGLVAIASASSAIVHSAHSGQTWSVRTYAGPVQATVSAVHRSSSLTILFLPDTLNPADADQFERDLAEGYAHLRGRSVQMALLRNDGEFTGPVLITNGDRIKKILSSVPLTKVSGALPQPKLLDDLIAVLPKLGQTHGALLIAGELPSLDSASLAFASALLSKAFGSDQTTVNLLSPANSGQEWTTLFRSRGGDVIHAIEELHAGPVGTGETLLQLNWAMPPAPAGFVLAPSIIVDDAQNTSLTVRDLSSAEGVVLPSIEQYCEAQKKVSEAQILLAEEPLTQARADRIRENIGPALQLNSRDAGALRVAIQLYEKAQDYKDAVNKATSLVEVSATDGSAQAMFGHALLLNSELDRSELALNQAQQLGLASPELNEDFARLHIARKDDKGALPYLKEALHGEQKNQELWFLQGGVAERTGDTDLAESSYEQGLAFGGVHLAEVGSLLRLYLAGKQEEKFAHLAEAQLASLPSTPEDRIQLASTLDDLHQNSLALEAWRKLVEVQPGSDRGHTRIAQLLLEGGNASGAEDEANAGLSVIPNSATLRLVKAEAEVRQGRVYRARQTLEDGADLQSEALAIQLATLEEKFFGSAAAAYARVADLSGTSSPHYLPALERAFDTAMRDGDLAGC